ncbi:MAG TPA: hypothetical protein VFX28_22820, partial [Methylomirabilota bacterium]|nr:hypothetical protein [Methylomirabilota bacterium]
TFGVPVTDLHAATLATLERLEIPVVEQQAGEDGVEITGQARDRTIRFRLERVSPALTRMRLVVAQSLLGKDRATAAEIIAQTERTLAGRLAGSAAPRRLVR